MNNKAVNRFNRIFYPSIIIMIVSLFLLTGTTYAWFNSESQSSNNTISSGSLVVDISIDSTNIELSQKANVSMWVLESEELELNENQTIYIENNGSLNSVITIDYLDGSIEDIVLHINSLNVQSYIVANTGTAYIYCQSEYSYNLTI